MIFANYWNAIVLAALVAFASNCNALQTIPHWNFHRRHASSSRLQYSVRIVDNTKNVDQKFEVKPGELILDAVEAQGCSIPYSCRAGACSTCVARLLSGKVDQSSQVYLNDEQIAKGFILTCSATPLSDLEIQTSVEDELY